MCLNWYRILEVEKTKLLNKDDRRIRSSNEEWKSDRRMRRDILAELHGLYCKILCLDKHACDMFCLSSGVPDVTIERRLANLFLVQNFLA